MDDDRSAEDLAWDELATLIKEAESLRLCFTAYLRHLEREAESAARKLEVARAHADTCAATKLRKPRCDRGRKRVKSPAAPTAASPSSLPVPGDHGPEI